MNLTDEQWALIQPLISSFIQSGVEGTPIPVPGGTDPPDTGPSGRCDRVASGRDRGPISNPQLHPEQSPTADLASQKGSWQGPGRPPADPRATLNGILRKIRLAAPWYDLPPYTSALHPSWQTCYRRYRNWHTAGLMDHIYRLLNQDLRDRGGIDLVQVLGIGPPGVDPACCQRTIPLTFGASGWHLHLPPELEGTWQASTVHLLVQVILRHLEPPLRPSPTRTLTIEYHHPEQESAS